MHISNMIAIFKTIIVIQRSTTWSYNQEESALLLNNKLFQGRFQLYASIQILKKMKKNWSRVRYVDDSAFLQTNQLTAAWQAGLTRAQ